MTTPNTEMTLKVTGMDCAGCARSVETGVRNLSGVAGCELNFTTEKLRVSGTIDRQTIIDRVRELGFDVAADTTTTTPIKERSPNFLHYIWQRLDTRLALVGVILILPGLIFEELAHIHHPLIDAASLAAMVVAGWPIARSAWRAIKINREININVLMTIAALGAVVIGAYTEAGMVMVLFAIGEALEGYTASRARDSIRSLMEVVPQTATRLDRRGKDIREVQVGINDLQVGDVIVVKPGERIPMDGRVQAGTSAVNQAPITGESKLIDKATGAEIFAGSINGQGVLEIEVTRLAEDNTISRLIQMVEEAQEKRAPSQRFIDKFAAIYTPAVMGLALLVAVVPPLFFGQPFWNPNPDTFGWLYRGLALLVVACPCALVISTPVSVISAISNAARQGVLIKGGAYLEALNRIETVALDKTGTLTRGQPSVIDIRSAACTGGDNPCPACDDVLALASAVERRSEHPLAHAILTEADQRGVRESYPVASGVQSLTGRGVVGQVDGQQILIGSHTYFDGAVPHGEIICRAANSDAQQGYTPLLVEANGQYIGTITVADTVRADSHEAMIALRQVGVKQLIMLTGDNQSAAESIAAEIGLTDVRAELLPEDKVAAVRGLQADYGAVAMVGDGINDAPALATADVSIAIGGASGGTTQAMETADITLMSDNLSKLAFLFGLSRATIQTIGVNVILSIGVKLVFLVLVLLGLGTMWMAVLADMGTSLLVTLNGMRLVGYRSRLSP